MQLKKKLVSLFYFFFKFSEFNEIKTKNHIVRQVLKTSIL